MAITEEQVYAALGMEKPADTPEVADPATIEGANEQGVTDPAGAEENASHQSPVTSHQGTGDADASEGTDPSTAASGGPPPLRAGELIAGDGGQQSAVPADADEGAAKTAQSKEERAEQARLRREREKKAAVDAAVSDAVAKAKEAHEKELSEIFAAMGVTDRHHDGKPITNLQEFRAWQQANQAAGLNRKLKAGELTAEDLQGAIEASPVMQQAKAALDSMQAEKEAAERARVQVEFQQVMERELREINQLDPGVKTLEDALNLPTGQEFARLVNERGLSYIEAFKLANMERITKARTMGAAQGEAQRRHSKDHLRAIGIAGGPAVEIPAETLKLYRELCPDMTPEQIRQDYIKTMGIR